MEPSPQEERHLDLFCSSQCSGHPRATYTRRLATGYAPLTEVIIDWYRKLIGTDGLAYVRHLVSTWNWALTATNVEPSRVPLRLGSVGPRKRYLGGPAFPFSGAWHRTLETGLLGPFDASWNRFSTQ